MSIRARYGARLMNRIPYLYLGYTSAETEVTLSGIVGSFTSAAMPGAAETISGFSYGVGIDLFGSSRTSMFCLMAVCCRKMSPIIQQSTKRMI